MFNSVLFENRAVWEIKLKNNLEPVSPQMTIWCMRIACWIPKATDTDTHTHTHTHTHTQYALLIAFPPKQWLHERTSVLCYRYMDCLVNVQIFSYRLRWSTGSVLAFGTQVRGFKPG